MESKHITIAGAAITVVYLALISTYIYCEWDDLLDMTPNELGDFLAGTFGPLALFWLICGYLQQGVELRLNTEVLRMQAKELKNSSRALKYQVAELRNSVEQQSKMASLAAQQLEHEVQKAKKAEQEREAQFLPVIEVFKYTEYMSHAPGIGEVQLINSGAPVAVLDEHSNSESDHLTKKNRWDNGDLAQFVPFRVARDPSTRVELSMRLRQANGLLKMFELVMEPLADGLYGPPVITIKSPTASG